MNCPNCDRTIPADSRFCIYCSAPLEPAAPVVETRPALGPTQRLDPAYNLPRPVEPVASPVLPPRSAPRRSRRGARNARRSMPMGAIWLIGLGVLFLTDLFWPGILVLIGLSSFADQDARGKRDAGLSSLVFFSGLALLFLTEWFWPGIFVLALVMWFLNNRNGRGWTC